jgi:hypothetical protein
MEEKLDVVIRSAVPVLDICIDTAPPWGISTPTAEGPTSIVPDGDTMKAGVPGANIGAPGLETRMWVRFSAPASPYSARKIISNVSHRFVGISKLLLYSHFSHE